MPDSIPEKTLEHWASTYLTYRFRSKVGLWWPAFGEDITVQHLPQRPGKSVLLEVKTSWFEPKQPDRHIVTINVAQLQNYLRAPLAMQPYYVFPIPTWSGEAKNAALSAGADPTEGAFSRNAYVKPVGWMAEWLQVLPAREVANWVRMSASNSRMVRIDVTPTANTVTWVNGSPAGATAGSPSATRPNKLMRWREFWSWIQRCGDSNASQVIILPMDPGHPDSLTRQQILDLMREERQSYRVNSQSRLVFWGYDGQNYVPLVNSSELGLNAASDSLVGVHMSLDSLDIYE